MILENFKYLGGRHCETANLRSTLAYAGVKNPVTGQPLSEALLFGIAGGIGAGYLFCPSILRYGGGSGVSLMGRHLYGATGPGFIDNALKRLGAATHIAETAGEKGAFKNLTDALDAGKPGIVYCTRRELPWLGLRAGCGGHYSYTLAVVGVDEAKGVAFASDCARIPVKISLEALAKSRAATCSHRNRLLTFDPPKKLDAAGLKKAITAGIGACVEGLLNPRIKTFGYESMEAWASVVANPKSKKGWMMTYPGGKIGIALRDIFDSIETTATGGGLFRALFAEFLDEAASVMGNKALSECAVRARTLAESWSALAQTALPAKYKPFKESQELLRKQDRLIEEKGSEGAAELAVIESELARVQAGFVKSFPLDTKETIGLLEQMSAKTSALLKLERAAILKLKAVAL